MTRSTKYPPEIRERAVRMVFEHEREHPSQWATIRSVFSKFGMSAETLRSWVRQVERDQGRRPGLTTTEREEMRRLEREVKELRRANEMAVSTGERNDLFELLQWCQIAEGPTRPSVEAALDLTQVSGRVLREVGPLGQVLAQEPVGVLV